MRRIYRDPMTGKADWKLEFVVDRTGAIAGIKDLHSLSTAEGLLYSGQGQSMQ